MLGVAALVGIGFVAVALLLVLRPGAPMWQRVIGLLFLSPAILYFAFEAQNTNRPFTYTATAGQGVFTIPGWEVRFPIEPRPDEARYESNGKCRVAGPHTLGTKFDYGLVIFYEEGVLRVSFDRELHPDLGVEFTFHDGSRRLRIGDREFTATAETTVIELAADGSVITPVKPGD